MKRFYKLVSIEKVAGGYHILLDNKPIRAQSGAYLCAPNEKIAQKVMQEWSSQGSDILPDTMPFTQILNTKIDRVSREREAMSAHILKYLDTDLICYFAADPQGLVDQQKDKWQIWIDWFEREFGYVLKTTTGLAALAQDKGVHDAIARYVGALNDDYFIILQLVTSISGSLVLGLAMVKGVATAQQIFDACFVEENFKENLYNAEKYGSDPLLEKTQKSKIQDLKAAYDYISLL